VGAARPRERKASSSLVCLREGGGGCKSLWSGVALESAYRRKGVGYDYSERKKGGLEPQFEKHTFVPREIS